ncbi:MAG: response regulator transcription factor [Spirochaetales bacterium]|nr:response regulator transcription factor [Spirochaetales bacterium]
MPKETVLIVDDEESILKLIKYNLENDGYKTAAAASGESALSKAFEITPDIIVLDLMLPGLNGLEVCRLLSKDKRTSHIPILMLTARSDDSDIIEGLEAGADDYITKPFSPKILIARLKTILRRAHKNNPDTSLQTAISIHKIYINLEKHEVTTEGSQVELSFTEFAILTFLCRNPGWVYSRNQIISAVKGENYPVTERSVDVQILGIRKKLKNQGEFLETVRGIGYRMAEAVNET